MSRNKIITIVFLISIGLNLFFLGMFVSRRVFDQAAAPGKDHRAHSDVEGRTGPPARGRSTRAASGPMRVVGDVVRVMGGKKDPRVSAVWQAQREHLKAQGKDLHKTHERLINALTALPYSEAKLNEALSEVNEGTLAAQRDAQQLLLQLAAQLTEKERKQLAQELEKRGDMTRKLR